MITRSNLPLTILIFFLSLLSFETAHAQAQPNTVFVFNHRSDGFDNNAEGFVWNTMGLLDAQGQPGTVQPNGNITNSAGAVLGTVIRNAANNVIGYRSADGTREAYNVSGGATTDQAWQRVAQNGTLHIVKHGAAYVDDTKVRHNGGGIMLDNGQIYDGFTNRGDGGAGTGVGYFDISGTAPSGAYSLTPRPGANVTLVINGCYTANDPDAAGPQKSVTVSATGVQGVANSSGHIPEVNANIALNLIGTPAQRTAAIKALQQAAKSAGFSNRNGTVDDNNVLRWIASLPFDQQYSRTNAITSGVGATTQLSYSKSEAGPGPGGDDISRYGRVTQLDLWRDNFGSYRYGYDEPTDDLSAALFMNPSSFTTNLLLSLYQLPELPVAAPDGRQLVSGIFDFRYLGVDVDLGLSGAAQPLGYEIDVLDALYTDVTPYILMMSTGGGPQYWQALDYERFDGAVRGYSSRIGVVAAFAAVPEPSTIVLVVPMLFALGFFSMRIRSWHDAGILEKRLYGSVA